jgi:chromosome segregation ATPase
MGVGRSRQRNVLGWVLRKRAGTKSAEAAAKTAQEKAVADAKAASEATAKIAQEKAALENQSIAERLSKLQSEYSVLSATFASNLAKYSEAMAQVALLQGLLKTLQSQVEDYFKPKPETIVCTKGISFKIVKAIAPKCPAGYKRR